MHKLNCITYALWRWFTKGGYLIIRKSHAGWFPHFIWAPSLKGIYLEHYTVDEHKRVPPLFFNGYVKTEDD